MENGTLSSKPALDSDNESEDVDYKPPVKDIKGGKKQPNRPEPAQDGEADALSDENDYSSDESDDDDDEDEEEEDAASDDSGRARKPKKKKQKRNMFIEEEAEVDEDDDEEEIEDYEEDDFINEAEDAIRLQPQIYRELDQRRDVDRVEDAEEVERRLKERYGRGAYAERAGVYSGDLAHVPMQFLLPSVKDPNLWLVKCRPGKERDIAMNLMRKYIEYSNTDHPLRIKSVVARDGLKGYLYVESRSQADVQSALDKMNNVYASKIVLVPLEEMVDVMTIKKKYTGLKSGQWVRVLRGKYKGDIAQVISADIADRAEIKLIPRLDFTQKEAGVKRKTAIRPQQRMFNGKDVPAHDKTLTKKYGMWVYRGDTFDTTGFLIREVNVSTLETAGVTPTLDEIAKFSAGKNVEDHLNMSTLDVKEDKATAPQFSVGDSVFITVGDLVNATATVKTISKNLVTLKMDDEDLGDIEIEPRKLARLFHVGDHVKCVNGKFKDETGMITQIEKNIVHIFSDASMKQFSVLSKDIRNTAEISVSETTQQSYNVQDFVQVGANTVGVIVKVDKDQYKIVDQDGGIKTVQYAEITQKRDSRKAVALDVNQNTLHSGDVVEVLVGEHANKQATILHLYRVFAFLISKDVVENAGTFVVKTKMIRLAGHELNKPNQTPGAPQMPGMPMAPPAIMTSNTYQLGKQFLHKTVYIISGPHKGYQAFVKNVSDKGVLVELNTNGKKITIDPKLLTFKTDADGNRGDRSRSRFAGGMTPHMGARTPAVGGFGGQTPSMQIGARTPAWDAGARTPAWDVGSRTPAFGFGQQEPLAFDNTWGSSAPTTSNWGGASVSAAPEYGNEWLLRDIEVKFKESQFGDEVGYVSDLLDTGKTGVVIIANQRVTVGADRLTPIQPNKKDRCVFIVGEYRGATGTLIGYDNDDAIVRLDSNADFKIASMAHVCKLRQ